MPWIGVEAGKIDWRNFRKYLKNLECRIVGRKFSFMLRIDDDWIEFDAVEVSGFIEGLAETIAMDLKVRAVEAGRHLILGEPSAKIWDEAVKIAYPDGKTKVIPIFTYDGFLSLKAPTRNVRGLKGYLTHMGVEYPLPLNPKNLRQLLEAGGEKTLEAAMATYGTERILSEKAREKYYKLIMEARKPKVEVDYTSGFVFIATQGQIITKPIDRYIESIAEMGGKDEVKQALKILENAPENLQKQIISKLEKLHEEHREKERKFLAKNVKSFLSRARRRLKLEA